uniref:Peptidase S1 domain-containing protein n=1 Tax=Dendroctonus ponderosae TaxID=77166 RepID=A0AAR5PUT3_DENPD
MDLRLVFVSLVLSSVNCRSTRPANLENVVPGHLESWNPELFEKIFPNVDLQLDNRIVGGIEATPHSRPYQVGIIVPVASGGSQFCGASLINTMNILTAAHCVDVLSGNLTAYLGAHNMLPTEAENATVLQTDEVVVYPLWNRSIILNDIALIHLKEPVELTANIQPIEIPEDDSQDYAGETSLVTGWGRPSETVAGISPVLNELTSHVMSNYPCRLAYLGYVEDSNICMSSYLGNATCSGDSGGPLTVDGVQVGVVSFGSGWGCAQGFPSVFARVTYYLDWIRENLKAIPETTTSTSTTEATTSTSSSSTTATSSTEDPSSTTSSTEDASSTTSSSDDGSTEATSTSTTSTSDDGSSTTSSTEDSASTTSSTSTTSPADNASTTTSSTEAPTSTTASTSTTSSSDDATSTTSSTEATPSTTASASTTSSSDDALSTTSSTEATTSTTASTTTTSPSDDASSTTSSTEDASASTTSSTESTSSIASSTITKSNRLKCRTIKANSRRIHGQYVNMASAIILCVVALASVVAAQLLTAEELASAVPAHLELDPEFRKLHPNIPGPSEDVDSFIVGGVESTPHSRRYQVGIYIPVSTAGNSFCGGSLINARTVVTAAHCVDIRVGNLSVYMGAHNMPPGGDLNFVARFAGDVVIHEGWNRSILLHDIALIRFEVAVPLSASITPVLLPRDATNDYLGNIGLVTGWGRSSDSNNAISPVLREVTSSVISNYACRLAYTGIIEESHICISGGQGRGTCNGDSGGPLVVNGVLVGVVSFGSAFGCEVGWPSAMTRVSYYLDWISQNQAPED